MPELVEPESKMPFESRNFEPQEFHYKMENDKSAKKLLNMGKNKTAIWASEAQVEMPKVKNITRNRSGIGNRATQVS
jgi:hypothetical protein